MRLPEPAVYLLRRMRAANMPDSARVLSFTTIDVPGGGKRRGSEVDIATFPCYCAPIKPETQQAATQDMPASKYVIILPLASRSVVLKEHLIEVTSTEFGWTKLFEIDEPPQAFHTNEVVIKCYCSEVEE